MWEVRGEMWEVRGETDTPASHVPPPTSHLPIRYNPPVCAPLGRCCALEEIGRHDGRFVCQQS